MRIALLFILAMACSANANAEVLRWKDGGEASGKIVQDDGEVLTVELPRQDVAAVDGKPLGPLMAPAFEVADLTGAIQRVPDPEGRVVVLKFWATWCPFCRSDVPSLTKLFERQDHMGVRVISVSVDEDVKALREFVRKKPVPYPVIAAYEAAGTPASKIPARYRAKGLPTYVIIDGTGAILKRFSGSVMASKTDLDAILKPLLHPAPPQ